MYQTFFKSVSLSLAALFFCSTNVFCMEQDPLPSWNEGAVKSAIIRFVEEATEEKGANYIAPAARIATFDQDGTLWVEKPLYPQWYFTVERLGDLASSPFSKFTKFVKNILNKIRMTPDVSKQELTHLLAVIDEDTSIEGFHDVVGKWLANSSHPDFKRPFTSLIYQPMLEALKLFQNNGFKTYIVSGGGQEFIRAYAEDFYQIPPEWVIGSAVKVKYENSDGKIDLKRTPSILYVNEKEGKPEAINLIIGRKPVVAFGNSDGDRQMLEQTWANKGLAVLIHHDDQFREYAYDSDSFIGKLTEEFMEEAKERNYQVVSMKEDWHLLFPWQLALP